MVTELDWHYMLHYITIKASGNQALAYPKPHHLYEGKLGLESINHTYDKLPKGESILISRQEKNGFLELQFFLR